SIAVDNFGNCIEVHCGVAATSGKLFCRVGKVDYINSFINSASIISWGTESEFDAGDAPVVSLSGSGECVVVFGGTGTDSGKVICRGGTMNATSRTVEWRPRIIYDAGEGAVVAMDDSGKSVEIHV